MMLIVKNTQMPTDALAAVGFGLIMYMIGSVWAVSNEAFDLLWGGFLLLLSLSFIAITFRRRRALLLLVDGSVIRLSWGVWRKTRAETLEAPANSRAVEVVQEGYVFYLYINLVREDGETVRVKWGRISKATRSDLDEFLTVTEKRRDWERNRRA